MKSYVAVEEIDKKYASCELEMIPVDESRPMDYNEKPTLMVHIPVNMITAVVPDVREGDILVVMHERGTVGSVCYRDDAEQQRRVELIKSLFQK